MQEEIRVRLREVMRQRALSALILISPESVCWTSGVMVPSQKAVRHRHAIVLLPAEGDPEMVVVNVEEGLVRAHTDIRRIVAYNEFTESAVTLLAGIIRARGLSGSLGVEARYLNFHDYVQLQHALSGIAELQPADDLVESLRMVKTEGEIARLARAAGIAEEVAFRALQRWHPGMTELELARLIGDLFFEEGGGQLTMLSVTSGERTPLLNGGPTKKEIREGEVVRIDVIGVVENYYCDVARTAVVGEPEESVELYWRRLVECRDMVLEMIRPGVSTRRIYETYIEKMDGWGMPTLEFVGHGVGLTLHEGPYLNRYSDCALQEGMVLAVEPLVVFPHLGMQLEETVVVEQDGCRLLTGKHDVRSLWRMELEGIR
jgi:Xaa-Pro dipeptidase